MESGGRTVGPRLSILIATQGRRNQKFRKLLQHLMRQVRPYKGEIEVIAYWNNGELSIGEIREALIKEATGEYICFIDDDDWVPDYYCEEIMNALGEDYVGFRVQLFNEGREAKPVYHDLYYKHWHEDDDGYYRGITRLNPLKREYAIQGSFHDKGAGEDVGWAKSITHLVKTQRVIDKIMYQYYHDFADTSFGQENKLIKRLFTRPHVQYKYFRFHPNSKLEREVAWNQ